MILRHDSLLTPERVLGPGVAKAKKKISMSRLKNEKKRVRASSAMSRRRQKNSVTSTEHFASFHVTRCRSPHPFEPQPHPHRPFEMLSSIDYLITNGSKIIKDTNFALESRQSATEASALEFTATVDSGTNCGMVCVDVDPTLDFRVTFASATRPVLCWLRARSRRPFV